MFERTRAICPTASNTMCGWSCFARLVHCRQTAGTQSDTRPTHGERPRMLAAGSATLNCPLSHTLQLLLVPISTLPLSGSAFLRPIALRCPPQRRNCYSALRAPAGPYRSPFLCCNYPTARGARAQHILASTCRLTTALSSLHPSVSLLSVLLPAPSPCSASANGEVG